MREKELILYLTSLGLLAGFLSQYFLKTFNNVYISILPAILIFFISFPFLIKKRKNILNSLVTFFSVWFVFWMILYGL